MTSAEEYIERVLQHLPRTTPNRAQIAMELRGHIEERVSRGQPLDDILRQLGDPLALAESYLAAVPLVSGPFWHRAAAKFVDMAMFFWIVPVAIGFAIYTERIEAFFGIVGGILLANFGFLAYMMISETRSGQTVGKRLLGLCVVRESGAKISFGQAFVRQLSMILEVIWLDMWFAVFTERKQRAFELLSKTRVVKVPYSPEPVWQGALAERSA